ncbi:MAG: DUF429 domain-containing protein [Bacteroidetes bacterium]|nr:DUF429 domain-containing protein [Bacteroidota bacterium]
MKDASTNMLAGIDLSASFLKPSSCAFLENGEISLISFNTNAEIAKWATDSTPDLIGLDAPLSIPMGLNGKFGSRECERDLLKEGIPVLMTSLIAPLTFRAIHLVELLSESEIRSIEVYPYSLRKQFNIAPEIKKESEFTRLKARFLEVFPFDVNPEQVKEHHDVDALLALWMTKLVFDNAYKTTGNPEEGLIYLPL